MSCGSSLQQPRLCSHLPVSPYTALSRRAQFPSVLHWRWGAGISGPAAQHCPRADQPFEKMNAYTALSSQPHWYRKIFFAKYGSWAALRASMESFLISVLPTEMFGKKGEIPITQNVVGENKVIWTGKDWVNSLCSHAGNMRKNHLVLSSCIVLVFRSQELRKAVKFCLCAAEKL